MIEQILSRLMDTICENRYDPVRVMLDKFMVEREKIFIEVEDAYSEKEIQEFRKKVKEYGFINIILHFHNDYDELY